MAKEPEVNPMHDLIRRRIDLGMTQADVARRCGRPRSWAHRLEKKSREELRFRDLLYYAKAVGYKLVIEITDKAQSPSMPKSK